METFTERMIKRTQRRSNQCGNFNHHPSHKTEESHLQDQVELLSSGINLQKSCDLGTRKVSLCDYESLPIRSPRSYKFGDSFFSTNSELNMMNKNEGTHKENILLKETLGTEMSRLDFEKTDLKDLVEENISPLNHKKSQNGAKFLPNSSSTCILGFRSEAKLLKNSPNRTLDELTDNSNFKIKQLDLQYNQLSNVAQQKLHDSSSIKKDVDGKKETETFNFEFCPTSCKWTSISETNKKTLQNIEHGGENSTLNINNANTHNLMEQEVQKQLDSMTVVITSTGTSVCTFEFENKDSEGKSDALAEYPVSNIDGITTWCEHSGMTTCDPVSRMNLEKLDDKEDRLSQLDEINVSTIKVEELNLPGLKLAQIVTEKLPLSFIHDLPQPSSLERSSYSCPIQCNMKNTKENKEAVVEDAGGIQLGHSSVKETCEYYGIMCKSNMDIHSNYKSHILQEYNSKSNRHLSKINVTNLESTALVNRSDWDFQDSVSSGNYNTLSDSSLNNLSLYSVHSSDISFGCPCSTSIGQSSTSEEIPSSSLPYLLLQHLSLGKKMKNDAVKARSLGMYNFKGNDTTIVIGGNSADTGGDDSDVTKINVYEEESELLELKRKVLVETIIADQASKALHLCYSSPVFAGSTEQVEGERLLLLSTIRKLAVLDEMRRLTAQTTSNYGKNELVEVTIKDIKLLIRDGFMDVLTASKQQDNFYFLCLISYQDTVLGTEAIAARSGQPTINFLAKNIKIKTVWLDELWICFRVYMLQVKQNKLEKTKGKQQKKASEAFQYKHVTSKRDPHCLFSCGSTESEKQIDVSNNVCGKLQTRVPGFILINSVELHLPDDLSENYFILQQHENCINDGDIFQPLHDTVHLKISCAFPFEKLDVVMNKTIFVQYQGFLTQFSMISGTGAWQRGWWSIKGSYLMCWKYPEDEEKLPPLIIFDLKLCTEKILPVSRLKCARSNTFSIKMKAEGSSVEGTEISHCFPADVSATDTITESKEQLDYEPLKVKTFQESQPMMLGSKMHKLNCSNFPKYFSTATVFVLILIVREMIVVY